MSKRSGIGRSLYQAPIEKLNSKEFSDPKIKKGFDLAKKWKDEK